MKQTNLEYIESICEKENVDKSIIYKKFHELDTQRERIVYNKILTLCVKSEEYMKHINDDFIYVTTLDKKDVTDIIKSDMFDYDLVESKNQVTLFVRKMSDRNRSFNVCRVEYSKVDNFEKKYLTKEFKKRFKIRRMKRNNVLSYYLIIK